MTPLKTLAACLLAAGLSLAAVTASAQAASGTPIK
ncbi:MAG: hypothetical protein JWQ11_1628, partial [Rhizobacter sp.]|nr:hypothetical protein [Rhizobacter sp.]